MKRIKLGGREIDIQASPLTPLHYKRAFGQSMAADLLALMGDTKNFDEINLLQMVWAMEKTANNGKLIDFETWLGQFEYLDLLSGVAVEITGVAWDAVFRTPKEEENPEAGSEPK